MTTRRDSLYWFATDATVRFIFELTGAEIGAEMGRRPPQPNFVFVGPPPLPNKTLSSLCHTAIKSMRGPLLGIAHGPLQHSVELVQWGPEDPCLSYRYNQSQCQSANHTDHSGDLWQCARCTRWFCENERPDHEQPPWADHCEDCIKVLTMDERLSDEDVTQ